MTHTINNSTPLLPAPVGGRGTKKYVKPRLEIVYLDNEISLALESTPPEGPGEVYLDTNKQYIDPFQTNFG